MLVATALFVATLSILFLWWMWKPSKYHQQLAKIPGPAAVPIFGNALHLKADTVEFFDQIMDYCKQYETKSSMFKLLLGNHALIIVFRASAAEKILSSMRILTKAIPYDLVKPWLGTGLLTSTGEKWQTRRKMLTPTFHFKILADFLHVFNEQAEVLVEKLSEKSDKAPFDVFPLVALCTLDIICETAMGKKIHAQKSGKDSPYVQAVNGISDLVMVRVRSPWYWPDFIFKRTERGRRHESYLNILHGFTQKVINERMKEMELNPENFNAGESGADDGIGEKRRRAFLDLLLHMAKEAHFTKEDIQEEVDTFMFEGHDTTASGISWTMQLVGSHPEVQRKLQAEMDSIFGESDRPATMEDLNKMKYLECVIKESLRLCPPVGMLGRVAEEDTVIDGLTIPKGASVVVLIKKVNYDEVHFPEPDVFDPERFLPDRSAGRNPYAFIPFSAGPRNCIGQKFAVIEEKCVLSRVLRKFTIESTQTIEEIRPIPDLILRPTNGINIKLSKRTNK